MKRFVLVFAVSLAAVITAAPATANVPNGKGLEFLQQFVPLDCDGNETFAVKVTRGGGATGWRVDQNQHHVLSYFSITVYYPAPIGTVTDAKTWGEKNGIDSLDCSQDIPAFGGFPAIHIEGTIHPLPIGGD